MRAGAELLLMHGGATGLNPVSFSPHTWLDANQLTGLNNSDPVTTWQDVSGAGRNATQATTAQKPTYLTGIQNGKPVVRFDGTDDRMATAAFTALNQPNTLIAVAKVAATATTQIITDGIGAGNRAVIYKDAANNYRVSSGTDVATGATITGGIFNVLAVVFNGASTKAFLNGSFVSTVNAGTHTLTGLTLGAANNGASPLNGDIAEIILFNSALADGVIIGLYNTYFKPKWGL